MPLELIVLLPALRTLKRWNRCRCGFLATGRSDHAVMMAIADHWAYTSCHLRGTDGESAIANDKVSA